MQEHSRHRQAHVCHATVQISKHKSAQRSKGSAGVRATLQEKIEIQLQEDDEKLRAHQMRAGRLEALRLPVLVLVHRNLVDALLDNVTCAWQCPVVKTILQVSECSSLQHTVLGAMDMV
jgi:hypothetical protein